LTGEFYAWPGEASRSQFRRALAAIAATLPDNREAERRPDGKGAYFVTLPHDVLYKLNYLREPGKSYSDVILTLAKASSER
jgi:hypothetical protein